MRLAPRGGDAVGRHGDAPRLQPFLQFGLGVLGPAVGFGGLDDLAEQTLHHGLGRRVATVQEDGADDRLQRVGQDRRPLRAAATPFTFGQAQQFGQAERQRRAVQAVFAHQVGAHAREVTLVAAREALVQQRRNPQAEHCVTQEFEPLVVFGAEAAMRERLHQQRWPGEVVAQPPLQGLQCRAFRHPGCRATLTWSAPRT